MYFYELLITMVILIPAAVVYAWYVQVQALFYIYFILTLLLIPLLPLTLGAILGAVIAALSSKVRKSNIVQVILMTAVTLAFMAFSMTASSGSLS
jgi:ABC-2 type transport system permease protein